MFEMGVKGGKTATPSMRGVQPEWFFKGTGMLLAGHNGHLEIPEHTEDGGEEPEIAGCYIIDDNGIPCRIGFAIGNEWSDHQMEKVSHPYDRAHISEGQLPMAGAFQVEDVWNWPRVDSEWIFQRH
jgi:hypothetical protein